MNVWFISDPHFGHANILNFMNSECVKTRPEFKDVDEMDRTMIERWNATVGQFDKIYCLGDLGFNKKNLESILPRLNGKKRLILGNHDKFNMLFYCKYFEKIMESWQPARSVLFTHRPTYMGPDEPHRKVKANVHGHIHRGQLSDPRYLNISVEETNYTPIHYEDIVKILKKRNLDV